MKKDRQKTPPTASPSKQAKVNAPNDPPPLERMRELVRRVIAVPKSELPPNVKRKDAH